VSQGPLRQALVGPKGTEAPPSRPLLPPPSRLAAMRDSGTGGRGPHQHRHGTGLLCGCCEPGVESQPLVAVTISFGGGPPPWEIPVLGGQVVSPLSLWRPQSANISGWFPNQIVSRGSPPRLPGRSQVPPKGPRPRRSPRHARHHSASVAMARRGRPGPSRY
jgi:hypothetical protein